MPFQLQNARVVSAAGRFLSDPDFSRAWRANGVRPSVTGTMEGNDCVLRCSNTVVRISFGKVPQNKASCPISQSAEAMAALGLQIESPYPVDFDTQFFIPAGAITCTLEDGTQIYCEGMYDIEDNSIRIDAVDQERYAWFYAAARFEM